MKLLIFTQAVDLDDPILAFAHRWIEEFATRAKHVHVVCLKEGRHDLPENVSVHTLGKESGSSRLKYLWRFYRYAFSLRHEYDAVFVHMNPEYIVLGGFLWRLLGKRVVLWYTHRQVNWEQRVALFFAHSVVTAAPESFRIKSPKVEAIGHGIDTARFAKAPLRTINAASPRIVSVGRITPIKNLDIAIRAIALLRKSGLVARLDLIGSAVSSEDETYLRTLRDTISAENVGDVVVFRGVIPNERMQDVYPEYDLSLNLCPTGGIDKAVLESIAAGTPVLVANEAFRDYFGPYAPNLLCAYRDPDDTAKKIQALLTRGDMREVQQTLQQIARRKADVANVVSAIMQRLQSASV